MTTTFPGSPKVQKGAIIGIDPFNPLASVIIFQYNPDTLTRTLTAQTTEGNRDRNEAMRITGPPNETFKIDVEVDATDQMETGDSRTKLMGIHPTLASLEMLIYPKSSLIIANEVLARIGTIEIIPPEAPLTLFIWGVKRIVPVRVSELSITEEAFDTNLNPIRAKVSLGLRVLNYNDLGLASVGGGLFMAHQVVKEVMATIGGVRALSGS